MKGIVQPSFTSETTAETWLVLIAELGGDLVHDGDLVDLEFGDGAFGQFHGGYGTGSRSKNQ